MKKKLLVLGLMCALGSIGYGFEFTAGDTEGKLNEVQTGISKVEDQVTDLNKFKEDLQRPGTGIFANLESADQKLDEKDKEIEGKLDKLTDELKRPGTGILANLESADQKLDEKDKEIEGKLGKLDEKIKDYNDVKENAESAIILAQKNDDKIIDLYANKVDNQKFEDHKKQQIDRDNTQDDKIQANSDRIDDLQGNFDRYDGRLSGLENKVDNLDDKLNKGLSLMTAMNAVDFQSVSEGELAIGAGFGHYGNSQSVAVGVAYAPTQNLNLNMKYSVTAGDLDSFAIGAGASYKVRL